MNQTDQSDEKSQPMVNLYGKYPLNSFFQLEPAQYFIIAETNLSTLEVALLKLRKSIWWNAYGFFIIQKVALNSCDKALEYFKIVWSFNILSAIYVCMDLESKIRIHTFNPYSDYAPPVWIKYKSILQHNGHPKVLFKTFPADRNGEYFLYYNVY